MFMFQLLGLLILAVGIYVLVDPKFVQFNNLANFNVTAAAGNLLIKNFKLIIFI